jgi:hypothetical protein
MVLESIEKKKNMFLVPEMEQRFLDHSDLSLVAIPIQIIGISLITEHGY